MPQKVLVIDDSSLLREFLARKLSAAGLEVLSATTGIDGAGKIRSERPDLVIMEYHLARKPGREVLAETARDPNTKGTPFILVSTKLDRESLLEAARNGVKKFVSKPIKIDQLLEAVNSVLGVSIHLDSSPCVLEAHMNEDILFIEVSQGLNPDKIELLRVKIIEILALYKVARPKVLVMMTGLEAEYIDTIRLNVFFRTVLETTGAVPRLVRVLTTNDAVRTFIDTRDEFDGVGVTSNLEEAMDGLITRRAVSSSYIENRHDVRDDVIGGSAPDHSASRTVDLRFRQDHQHEVDLKTLGASVRLAIVDDDVIIQEIVRSAFADTQITIEAFNNGLEFMESTAPNEADLVFLDLMMPAMDGFEVLRRLSGREHRPPVIVLSALSKRETVVQVLQLGVSSYMIKPLDPLGVRAKASEILQLTV